MGCFGYICKGCGTQIVGDELLGGELSKLKHVRDGEVIGEAEGHYNSYGGVKEDKQFRNYEEGNPNNHDEICESELRLGTSSHVMRGIRTYKGKEITKREYESERVREILEERLEKGETLQDMEGIEIPQEVQQAQRDVMSVPGLREKVSEDMASYLSGVWASVILLANTDLQVEIQEEYYGLPKGTRKPTSGVVAWHKKCYEEAAEEEQADLTPSESDPEQSWGEVRDEFR